MRRRWFLIVWGLLLACPAAAQPSAPTGVGAGLVGAGYGAGLPDAVRRALGGGLQTEIPPGQEPPGASALQDGPVDPDVYRLGPGDEITIYYRGKTSLTQRLTVTPEGLLYLSDAGSLDVGGWTLAGARRRIGEKMSRVLRDVAVEIHLTRIRTFKVSVGGEVRRPGVYQASGATRLFELIRMAGGVTDSAAVRDIRLVRNDLALEWAAYPPDVKKPGLPARPGDAPGPRSIDLLPFVLAGAGDSSNPHVQEGEAVFIPRRSRLVTVSGGVLYPGTYDLAPRASTVGDLLQLLVLTPDAATDRIEVVSEKSGRAGEEPSGMLKGHLTMVESQPVEDGMHILVPRSLDYHRPLAVSVEGEVRYPGPYAIEEGADHLRDVIERAGGFTDMAVPARITLIRPTGGDTLAAPIRKLAPFPNITLTATEREILRSRGVADHRAVMVDLKSPGERGPGLVPGDRILVAKNNGFVEVSGRVRQPGFYPWQAGWSARDYIGRAGGFADRADQGQTRVGGGPGDNFRLAGDAGPPEPGDQVWVPEKIPRSKLDIARDTFLILAQVATIIIVIDQVTGN